MMGNLINGLGCSGARLLTYHGVLFVVGGDETTRTSLVCESSPQAHGRTEIVTIAKRNYAKYRDAVERMRYYSELGVEFRVCGLAAEDYGYIASDFQDFILVTPSAITELAHWQMQGFAIIKPEVLEKKYAIEEIR